MRQKLHQVAIFKSARLGFVGIANQVTGDALRLCQKTPFHPGWKAGTPASAQAAFLYLIHNSGRRHLKGFLRSCISAVFPVGIIKPDALYPRFVYQ